MNDFYSNKEELFEAYKKRVSELTAPALENDLTETCTVDNRRGTTRKRSIECNCYAGNTFLGTVVVCAGELPTGAQPVSVDIRARGWVCDAFFYTWESFQVNRWVAVQEDMKPAGDGYYWSDCWIGWVPRIADQFHPSADEDVASRGPATKNMQ